MGFLSTIRFLGSLFSDLSLNDSFFHTKQNLIFFLISLCYSEQLSYFGQNKQLNACFLILIIFSNLNYNCSKSYDMRNFHEQVKKATKNCSDLSLLEQIVLVISKFVQILGLHPRISKVFLDH